MLQSNLLIETQGGLLRVTEIPDNAESIAPPQNLGTRNPITEFSAASRRRFGRALNTLDMHQPMHFLTLTFGANFPNVPVAKQILNGFFKKLKRVNPDVIAVWKLEFQQRGAPHFHLLLLNWTYIDQGKLLSMWQASCGQWSGTHLDIRSVKGDPAKAMRYIAKYMRKQASLTNSSYLTAYPDAPIGRFWGVKGGGEIQFAPYQAVILRADTYTIQALLNLIQNWFDMKSAIERKYHAKRSVTFYSQGQNILDLEEDMMAVGGQLLIGLTIHDLVIDSYSFNKSALSMELSKEYFYDLGAIRADRYNQPNLVDLPF